MPDGRRWLTRADFPDWALVEASMLGPIGWHNHCEVCSLKTRSPNVNIQAMLCLVGAAAWVLEGDEVPLTWLSPEDQRGLRTA